MLARQRSFRPHLLAVLAALLTATVLPLTVGAGADAAGDGSEAELEPIGVLVADDQLDPRILSMELQGGAYDRAVAELESAMFMSEQTRRDLTRVEARADELAQQLEQLTASISRERSLREALVDELDRLEALLAERAVERYVRHGTDPGAQLDPTGSIDAARGAVLSEEVDEVQLRRRSNLTRSAEGNRQRLDLLSSERAETAVALTTTNNRAEELALLLQQLGQDVDDATSHVRTARRSAYVPGTSIPVIAFDAYLDAETAISATDPGCKLGWWMIAGVARVESRHGGVGGRHLRADGRVDRPIIGIALDGGPAVQLVADTDDGRVDGDAAFDRAVGPLQFIPETWQRVGRDGNGDGVADPQNIYDAAVSTGAHLCRSSVDLSRGGDLRAAYFRYNGSIDYVDTVSRYAARYHEVALPDRA